MNRRCEELSEDVRITEEANLDLKSEKSRLNMQLEEMRNGLRSKLN